tara:strand:- start:206 stop:406 length:201 start_codon:yes stop_codon:yes gene_type:complete
MRKLKTLKDKIIFTLELVVIVLLSMEATLPPNPYVREAMLVLVIIITLKYNMVERTIKIFDKFFAK